MCTYMKYESKQAESGLASGAGARARVYEYTLKLQIAEYARARASRHRSMATHTRRTMHIHTPSFDHKSHAKLMQTCYSNFFLYRRYLLRLVSAVSTSRATDFMSPRNVADYSGRPLIMAPFAFACPISALSFMYNYFSFDFDGAR